MQTAVTKSHCGLNVCLVYNCSLHWTLILRYHAKIIDPIKSFCQAIILLAGQHSMYSDMCSLLPCQRLLSVMRVCYIRRMYLLHPQLYLDCNTDKRGRMKLDHETCYLIPCMCLVLVGQRWLAYAGGYAATLLLFPLKAARRPLEFSARKWACMHPASVLCMPEWKASTSTCWRFICSLFKSTFLSIPQKEDRIHDCLTSPCVCSVLVYKPQLALAHARGS